MAKKNKFEAIVIGAGPSGLACAKVLTDNGISTLVLEKDSKPSSKNFSGGIVCQPLYESIFGKFEKETDFTERLISEFRAYLLNKDSFISLNNRSNTVKHYAVLREPFLNWIIKKTEKSGAQISYNTVVRDLIINDGTVCGVKSDDREFSGNIVIIAEGANSILSNKAGLKISESKETFIFAEEIIDIAPNLIEERFNLQDGSGLAAKLFTNSCFDAPGVSLLQTNKSSILLSTGILLSESISKNRNINEYHENLKSHPAIKPLISSGTTKKYSSYMLPASFIESQNAPKLCINGCIVTGSAANLVNPFSWDLSELAVLSGKLAAETIIEANKLKDFSEKLLSNYEKSLRQLSEYTAFKQQKPSFIERMLSLKQNNKNLSSLLNDGSDPNILDKLSAIVLKDS